MDVRKEGRMDEWMYVWMAGLINEWMERGWEEEFMSG